MASDPTHANEPVIALACLTFGSAAKADFWLRRPTSALNGLSPIDLLSSDEGRRDILDLLARIDHGLSA